MKKIIILQYLHKGIRRHIYCPKVFNIKPGKYFVNFSQINQMRNLTSFISVLCLLITISILLSFVPKINDDTSDAFVEYAGHGQDRGPEELNLGYVQQPNVLDAGRGKRLEALSIRPAEGSLPIKLSYGGHFQGIGDINDVSTGDILGTTGQGRRMEQLWIRVVGAYSSQYSVRYQIHQQDMGWSEFYEDGYKVGARGKRIEAVKIKIVRKPG